MPALQNPFVPESAMATGGSRKRRRLWRRTPQPPGLPTILPAVVPPIPFDPASADYRFDQHFDAKEFMIETMERPFFMILETSR